MLPPKYLSIEGHKDCMGTKDMGSWQAVCIHRVQPKKCRNEAWKLLNELRGTDEDVGRCPGSGKI